MHLVTIETVLRLRFVLILIHVHRPLRVLLVRLILLLESGPVSGRILAHLLVLSLVYPLAVPFVVTIGIVLDIFVLVIL